MLCCTGWLHARELVAERYSRSSLDGEQEEEDGEEVDSDLLI